MTRTDVAKRRPAAGKRAANTARADRPADSPGVTADHSARAERIARIAADLENWRTTG